MRDPYSAARHVHADVNLLLRSGVFRVAADVGGGAARDLIHLEKRCSVEARLDVAVQELNLKANFENQEIT